MSALADFRQRCDDTTDSSARQYRTDRAVQVALDVVDNNAEVFAHWLRHPARHRHAMGHAVQAVLRALRTIKQEEPR